MPFAPSQRSDRRHNLCYRRSKNGSCISFRPPFAVHRMRRRSSSSASGSDWATSSPRRRQHRSRRYPHEAALVLTNLEPLSAKSVRDQPHGRFLSSGKCVHGALRAVFRVPGRQLNSGAPAGAPTPSSPSRRQQTGIRVRPDLREGGEDHDSHVERTRPDGAGRHHWLARHPPPYEPHGGCNRHLANRRQLEALDSARTTHQG